MRDMNSVEVSADLSRVLEHLAGLVPETKDNESEFKALLSADLSPRYYRCTWWAGCYYCQARPGGPWSLIYCVA